MLPADCSGFEVGCSFEAHDFDIHAPPNSNDDTENIKKGQKDIR